MKKDNKDPRLLEAMNDDLTSMLDDVFKYLIFEDGDARKKGTKI